MPFIHESGVNSCAEMNGDGLVTGTESYTARKKSLYMKMNEKKIKLERKKRKGKLKIEE